METPTTFLGISGSSKSISESETQSSFFAQEKDHLLKKGLIPVNEYTSKQVDLVLNWRLAHLNREGLYFSFKKQLLSNSVMKQNKELQVAFSFERQLTVTAEDGFPATISLTLNLTPLVANLESVKVSVEKETLNS